MDPFIRDSVSLIRTTALWDLKWKARIKVDGGVHLFGTALISSLCLGR